MRDPFGIVGKTIDRRYAIRRAVAEGGFGVVYEAEAIALGVTVAIKVLKSEMLSDETRVRFEQEAKLLARLRHPAIVAVTDASHLDDGAPFLALEWIEGETLAAYLERVSALPLEDALRILGPVASAIAYAHEQGVVHRDLKPGNVMIGRTQASDRDAQSAKVLDFGLARWASPHGVKTTTDRESGLSIGYAAPEQYGKEFGPVDERADQFALAAMTFTALTARAPFEGETLTEVMFATCLAKERPSLAQVLDEGHFSVGVDDVLRRALAIRPEERFPTIRAFWSALEEAARGSAVGREGPATTKDAPAPRTVGASLPQQATLPSPIASHGAPRTDVQHSLAVAATLPSPPTSPTGTSPTGAIPSRAFPRREDELPASEEPATSEQPSRRSGARSVVLFVAIGAALAAGAVAAWPLVMPPIEPTAKPVPSASAPKTKLSAAPSASASASVEPCGGPLLEGEACIFGGRFIRGPRDCQNTNDPAHRGACPARTVDVKNFALDKIEVSATRYAACVTAGACAAPAVPGEGELPVRGVAQADALKFCAWDHAKRLPTDDEWELAAKGMEERAYPWGNGHPTPETAVFAPDDGAKVEPVAVTTPKGATADGVLHLAGNVAEWTGTDAPSSAPWPEGVAHVEDAPRAWVRGGAFDTTWDALRTWARSAYPLGHTSASIGFRCARTPRAK